MTDQYDGPALAQQVLRLQERVKMLERVREAAEEVAWYVETIADDSGDDEYFEMKYRFMDALAAAKKDQRSDGGPR